FLSPRAQRERGEGRVRGGSVRKSTRKLPIKGPRSDRRARQTAAPPLTLPSPLALRVGGEEFLTYGCTFDPTYARKSEETLPPPASLATRPREGGPFPCWVWFAIAAAIVAAFAAYLFLHNRAIVHQRIADAKTWDITGPPCPAITKAEFLTPG